MPGGKKETRGRKSLLANAQNDPSQSKLSFTAKPTKRPAPALTEDSDCEFVDINHNVTSSGDQKNNKKR